MLMPSLKLHLISTLLLIAVSSTAYAENSDRANQESYLRAREMNHQQNNPHAAHQQAAPIDKSLDFRGVFYGYLPCSDCNGIKTILSLKQHNNYLLVTQPARDSSREFYEKGKYTWDEATQRVTLTPRNDAAPRTYAINDEGTLEQLNGDGKHFTGSIAERYTLRRSDMVKAREVHIH
jgi:uncharacterized lipoprotein NlpE involved in copper resistance